jgi:hypothetical protein
MTTSKKVASEAAKVLNDPKRRRPRRPQRRAISPKPKRNKANSGQLAERLGHVASDPSRYMPGPQVPLEDLPAITATRERNV